MVAATTPVAPTVQTPATAGLAGTTGMPVSMITAFQTANNAPDAAQTTPQLTSQLLTAGGADLIPIKMAGAGTLVQFALLYNPASAQTTSGPPIVWAIGLDANGVAWRLKDSTGAIAWTMTVDGSNDCAIDATHYYTLPVIVDATGADRVILAIFQAATGTAFTKAHGAAIVAHVL